MPKNLDQTGVVQVNGAWATSVKYESEVLGTRAGIVDLRFMQGRAEIGRVSLLPEEVAEVLGEKNAAAITRHLAGDADKYLAVVKGELRGTRLQYREVRLEENAIEAGRERAPSAASRSADGATPHDPQKPSPAGAGLGAAPEPERRPSGPEPDHEAGSSSRTGPVPPHIVARYLVKHDKYYFDDQTVAFVDKGSRLTVQTHNSAVLKDLMEIAKSREWQEIHLTGTKAFRREAWKEAYAAGLKVSGYTPSEIEFEAAKRANSRAGDVATPKVNSADRPTVIVPPGTLRQPVDVAPPPPRAPSRRDSDPARGMVYGTLVNHGVAPYRNDPSKSASYFVTVRDEAGAERTHWGVGLADAMRTARSAPQLGDEIGIRRVGSTAVTLPGRDADWQGAVSPIAAKRHQWLIETAQYLKSDSREAAADSGMPPIGSSQSTPPAPLRATEGMTRSQEAAAAIRSADTTREELQLKYPEINRAVFDTLAAHEQFADAYIKARLIRESDRAQVIAQMRERVAADLERGKQIRDPQERVNAILRSSVYEAATRIGRTPVDIKSDIRQPPVREEAQVRS